VPNHKAEIENGVENSTPFFCTDDLAENGFFYSVNVELTGGALAPSSDRMERG